MDDGAGGTIRKTAASRLKTYVGGPDPSSADGDSLGTSSLEWSDLYLADGGVVYFGNDQDVTITHDPDDGLFFKSKPTTNTNPFILTLQTGETDIANNDVIGEIRFHVPDEANGGDATAFGSCASIKCVGAGAFSSTSNASKIQFHCGGSEDPLLKAVIHSNGDFQVGGGADNNNETTRGAYAKTNGELNAHVDTTNDSPVTIEAFSAGGNGTTQSKFMTSADGSVNSRNNNYASYSDNR